MGSNCLFLILTLVIIQWGGGGGGSVPWLSHPLGYAHHHALLALNLLHLSQQFFSHVRISLPELN